MTPRWRHNALIAGLVVAALAVLLVAALLVLTQTDWGRERVRQYGLAQLRRATDGQVHIGRLEGNLLRRARLIDVWMVDEQEQPFLRADTLETGYAVWPLLRRRLFFSNVRLVNAQVVLDQPPGEDWNYKRIFRIDPQPPREPRPRGWGDWIRLRETEIVNGNVTIRSEWRPSSELTPAERQRVATQALSEDSRPNIHRVPGGFQNIVHIRDVHGRFPFVRLTDPDRDAMRFDIATLSGTAQPFRPPVADVRDLVGRVRLSADSLWFDDVKARLPDSRIDGSGAYYLETAELLLDLRGAPAAFADLRWLYPQFPEEGGGNLRLAVHRRDLVTTLFASEMDVQVGPSHLGGQLGLMVGDTFRIFETDLRMTSVDTRLLERMIPPLELPRHGTLDGRLALEGAPAALRVDGDVAFTDFVAGRSRVIAAGLVGMEDDFFFRDLRLRFDPLQSDLARELIPQLPPRATLTGPLRLNGVPSRLHVAGDLVLRDPVTGTSGIGVTGEIATADELHFHDLHLRFDPLRLDLVRPYAPDVPAGATLAGEIRLDGRPTGLLNLAGAVTLNDPATGVSRIGANGGIEFGEPLRFRDLALRFDPLQVDFATALGPDLPISGIATGNVTLNGSPRGTIIARGDLVHIEAGERSRVAGRAEIVQGRRAAVDLQLIPLSLVTAGRFAPAAGLHGSVTGTIAARGDLDNIQLRTALRLQDGGHITAQGSLDFSRDQVGYDLTTTLRAFDLAAATTRAPASTMLSGSLDARGRGFDPATMHAVIAADLVGPRVDGLAADELRLRVSIADGLAAFDSSVVALAGLEAWVHGTFGLIAGRYGVLAYRVQVDSLHAFLPGPPPPPARAGARLVGQPTDPAADPALDPTAENGVREPPRTGVGGYAFAEGTLRGNIEQFDAVGRAEAERFAIDGTYIGRGEAEYTLLNLRAARPTLSIAAQAEELQLNGIALDSARVRVEHYGLREGTGRAVIAAYQDDDTDYHADVAFTLALDRSELRLHDVAIRLDTENWRSTQPSVVSWADDGVDVERVELRSDRGGMVFIDGRLPIEGAADLDLRIERLDLETVALLLGEDIDIDGLIALDVRITGTLRSPRLEGRFALTDAVHDRRELPEVHASVHYADTELTFDAVLLENGYPRGTATGSLPIDLAVIGQQGSRLLDRPLAVDVHADSIPLEVAAALTDEVEDVRGHFAGDIAVRGTFDSPVFEGAGSIVRGALTVVPLGTRFRDVAGSLRLDGQTLVVDSLVAHSGGPIRVTGQLDMAAPTRPGFELRVEARNAKVYDTDDGLLWIDADLTAQGPFDALRLAGDVRTRRGVIYIPEDLDTDIVNLDSPEAATALRRDTIPEELLPRQSPLLANLELDLNLHIEEVWVRSTDANVEIYTPEDVGPLRVQANRASRELFVTGTVNSDLGEYTLLGRRFEITRGAATFLGDGDLNPILQIAAEHEVRIPGREGLEIRLVISGTLAAPQIALESSAQPPLSQTDLLSYLAFGRSSSSLLQQQGTSLAGEGGIAGDLVGNVAGFVTMQLASVAVHMLLDEFESEMAREFGLDVLNITPADLPTELFTGRFGDLLRGTEIELGRYIGPRLFLSVQARPTFETAPGARVEYRTPAGFRWRVVWEPRYLAPVPTLREIDPDRTRVFGAFLFREWRF